MTASTSARAASSGRCAGSGLQSPMTSASASAPGGIDDFDHLLQLGASGVQPAPVQHRGHGQRRRRRVLHSARVAAAVGAMPPPAGGDPVDDVRREQFDPAAGQRRRQAFGQLAVFVVAHPASRAVLVDQHRDRRIGFRRRGHVGDVRERVQQFLRKVNAHNASHFAAVDGDEHEGFLRHETEHGGQGRDQNAGPVEVKVGWLRSRHGAKVATCTVGYARNGRRPRASGDEFRTGDKLRAADATHLEHRVGEQLCPALGCPGRRRARLPTCPDAARWR